MAKYTRSLVDILREIAALPSRAERVDALRAAPRAIKCLLAFAFGPHTISLPQEPIPFDPISPKAFRWDEGEQYGDDILGLEAPKLIKLFTVGAPESHPTLTDAKRLDIYRSILERATEEEAELLQAIVTPPQPQPEATPQPRPLTEPERRYQQAYSTWLRGLG